MTCRKRIIAGFLSILLLAVPGRSYGQDDVPVKNTAQSYEQLQQEIIRLKRANALRDQMIKNLIRRIEALESRRGATPVPENQTPQAKSGTQAESVTPELEARLRQESEENYQLIQTAFEQRLTKEGGMLLPPYQLVYEPSLSYAHSSYDRIVVDGFTVYPVLVVGDIVAEKVRRDVFTNAHGFRLGLPGDVQLDLSIPLGYEEKRSFRDDGQYTEESTSGLGDISLAASYQLVNGSKFWPDTVVGLSWKSATGSDPYEQVSADEPSMGTGFETLGASLTMMAAADPAVLFGGISGSYTIGEDKSIGHVKPGAGYGFNLGMALALNFDTSLSMNYQYSHTLETEIESRKIRGSDLTTSNFCIGLSRSLSSRFAVDVDVSIGLAQDAPDHQITVSFPFRFSLSD